MKVLSAILVGTLFCGIVLIAAAVIGYPDEPYMEDDYELYMQNLWEEDADNRHKTGGNGKSKKI